MHPDVSDDAGQAEDRDRHGRRTPWIWGVAGGVLLIAAALTAWSLVDSDSESLEVKNLWADEESGVALETEYGSSTPTRVTGTSMDEDFVVGDPAGSLWDNTVPDQDMPFEYVDITGSKKVMLNYYFIPNCEVTDGWEEVNVTVETNDGERSATARTPELPTLVREWCALPMQVEAGSGSASANWCEVEREFLFTNPVGAAATVRLSTPGWQMEDLVIEKGEYEGMAMVTSDDACSLPRKPTKFIVEYEDGSEATITGPTPTKDM